MYGRAQISHSDFLTYILVDAAVFALKTGWSYENPASWTWTTRSELELLAEFYAIGFGASEKFTSKMPYSLFDADLSFTRPHAVAKALWRQLEDAFETPWEQRLTRRMKVARRVFEDRVSLIDKGLTPQPTKKEKPKL